MISIHWHLLLYVAIVVLIIIKGFSAEDDRFGMNAVFASMMALIVTMVYGGIFWW